MKVYLTATAVWVVFAMSMWWILGCAPSYEAELAECLALHDVRSTMMDSCLDGIARCTDAVNENNTMLRRSL